MRAPRVLRFLLVVVVGALTAGAPPGRTHGPATDPRTPGTLRMAQRLLELVGGADRSLPQVTPAIGHANSPPPVLPHLRQRLDGATTSSERFELWMQLSLELLQRGRSGEALRELDALGREVEGSSEMAPAERDRLSYDLHGLIGLAALRIAQQQVWIGRPGPESSLFPVRDGSLPRSSARRARDAFLRQLELQPDALDARWLLNLASMMLGEYPDALPRDLLLEPALFDAEGDVGRFRNVASEAGVDTVGLSGGAIMEDFDRDGLLDLVVSSSGFHDQLRYLHNEGDGTFDDRTREAGLEGEIGGLNLTHADYDNDGYPDILVLRGGWRLEEGRHPNSLLRNRGDGTFDDVTERAGLLAFHPTHIGAWGDYDNDGWLDLFVGNEQFEAQHPHPSQLFRNNGDGTFTDCAPASRLTDLGAVKGATWGDYDNDGRLDLYVSRNAEPNLLLHNDGPVAGPNPCAWSFTNVARQAGVELPFFSFPTWFWDYDNDGWLDLFAGTWEGLSVGRVAAQYLGLGPLPELPRLFHNDGNGRFSDVSAASGLQRALMTMGANYGDLDNDGRLDAYLGTGAPDLRVLMPNRMFRNADGRVFEDVTTSGGFGHLQKGHGVAFGDVDNDGDQDVYAVMGGWYPTDVAPNALFENPGHGHHWLSIELEGVRSNRFGLGARVAIRVTTPSGPRAIHRQVSTGGSFGSSPLRLDVGLGDALAVESVEVTWPASGEVQVFRDLAMDRWWRIREGDPEPLAADRRPIRLGRRPGAG